LEWIFVSSCFYPIGGGDGGYVAQWTGHRNALSIARSFDTAVWSHRKAVYSSFTAQH
jgi:hypothetical protein